MDQILSFPMTISSENHTQIIIKKIKSSSSQQVICLIPSGKEIVTEKQSQLFLKKN